jgi:hypothetical protein
MGGIVSLPAPLLLLLPDAALLCRWILKLFIDLIGFKKTKIKNIYLTKSCCCREKKTFLFLNFFYYSDLVGGEDS